MMTTKREAELTRILLADSPFEWSASTRLDQLASDLATLMPVVLDIRALDELGLHRDEELSGSEFFGRRERQESEKQPWWKTANKKTRSDSRPNLMVETLGRLDALSLTIMLARGQLWITTQESAEERLAIRLYDVSPLMKEEQEERRDHESLVYTIETHVDPDTWEALGGNSTIRFLPIRGRQWLIVSTTTVVHWKVQALLDRLNQ